MMRKLIYFSLLLVILSPGLLFSQDNYSLLYSPNSGISAQIQSKLESLAADPDFRIAGEKYHDIEYITNLYQKNNYQPFWTESQYTEEAISAIRMSYEDGLIPLDYHLEAILSLMKELDGMKAVSPEKVAKAADLELLLTDGVIFYADHLLYGKCDQASLIPTFNFGFAPVPDLNPETFRAAITGNQVTDRLIGLRPQVPLYDTLIHTLAFYREIEAKGGWQAIPTGGKIEPGGSDDRIPQIRKRLWISGELTVYDSAAGKVYDKSLEKDIKVFQSTHGLDADGVIGVGTFRELNVPVDKRIETIRVNLERIRWVAQDLPQDYLIVNIAAFWLVLVKDGQIVDRTKVVVGKPYTKTPIFRDKMRYIEFNPTWTVPTSIVKNEIIPKLKKDSMYLAHNNMILLDGKGNEVPISNLDLKNLSASRFPYLVRQQPGPDNALGVVKFMFPNEYDIYLHDTPSKSLFSRASRAYSHGCIRVEKPLDLAVLLLQGTEWTRQKIDATIKTQVTTRVNLPKPLDVLLMYWTCGLDPNRRIFFVPDVYDRDPAVIKDLDQLLR
jgi:L,D-transpeptidase YcbB